jgi:cytochrome P450
MASTKGAAIRPDDILTDEVRADPYPFYAGLRRHDPVHWNEPTRAWYIADYDTVTALLKDWRLRARFGAEFGAGTPGSLSPADERVVAPVVDFFERWMVFSNPPYQARIRTALQPAFTSSVIESCHPAIQATAEDSVSGFAHSGTDLLTDLIKPYAVTVVCQTLGVEPDEQDSVVAWSDALMSYLGCARFDAATAREAGHAVAALSDYVLGTVLTRGGDMVGRALADLLNSGAVEPGDAVATFAQLLTGGVEPVTAAATVAVTELQRDPGQRAALDRGEISYADVIEEALRYDPPFHFAPRQAMVDIDVAGNQIHAGDKVILVLASANRDEKRFAAADRFDARQPRGKHLAFGIGGHYCLGAVLARMELITLLRVLHMHLPALRIDLDALRRVPSFGSTVVRPVPALI